MLSQITRFSVFLLLIPTMDVALAADSAAGKQLVATCAACHGNDGHSGNPQWPNLAGQQAFYLAAQLKAFRDGQRDNAAMKPVAANLSDTDIDNLAAYFSGLPSKPSSGDAAQAKAGADKYAMCAGCHGAKGQGNGVFPRLAGQNPEYLLAQLKSFKAGTRKGGPMGAVAANLSEDDMKALSAYEASLR